MIDLGPYAADTVDDVAANLYRRIIEETERLLKQQLEGLGVNVSDKEEIIAHCMRVDHPSDPMKLTTYFYKDRPILGVRVAENMMGIYFEIPYLEPRKPEAQGGSE